MSTKGSSPHIGGGSSNIGAGSGDAKRDSPWIPNGDGIANEVWDGITKLRPGIITRDGINKV